MATLSLWLDGVGAGVGNHLWQSTAFAAVVWVVALLLKKNQARVRYGLWLAASVKFLIPFSLLIGLGGLLPRPRHSVVTMPVYSAVDAVGVPFAVEGGPEIAPAVVLVSRMQRVMTFLPATLAGVWVCGVVVVLVVWCGGWLRVTRTLRRARRVERGREAEILRRVEAAIGGRRRTVTLMLSRELMEPGMLGIWRPVLIWPERLSERLDDEHIEAIVAHELMHAMREDNFTAALHMIVEAVFWFHPMVWWMERRMVEERERACDEAVVAMGSRPGVYAESLLKACRFCVESPLVCVAGITGADLAARVRAIMTLRSETLGWWRKAALVGLAVGAIAGPMAFGVVRMIPMYGQVLHASGPLPSFEVATIRPSDPLNSHEHISFGGDRVNATLTTKTLIERAYGVRDFQVIGGPKWLDSATYDIVAKSDDIWDPSKLTRDQQDALADRQMLRLQSLLADRFHLKVHTTTKDVPVFALVVAKGGPKLNTPKESEPHRLYTSGPGNLACYSASMSELADELPDVGVGRIVVDRTHLTGRYDFWLKWTPDEDSNANTKDSGPSMFTALQEQLGLKLSPSKGPAEVVVIDRIEKPVFDEAEVVPSAGPSPILQHSPPAPPGSSQVLRVTFAQASAASPQIDPAPARVPRFDVVSIRRHKETDNGFAHIGFTGDGYSAVNVPIQGIILSAYGPLQISGVPSWADSERFDIEAKVAGPDVAAFQKLKPDQRMMMLQAIFADRFKLKTHSETKDVPAYALVAAKNGLKLKEAKPGDAYPNGLKGPDGAPVGSALLAFAGQRPGETLLRAQGVSMSQLARTLSRGSLGRIVIDKTGLAGTYDFTLEFTAEQQRPDGAPASDNSAPSIFTALQEQLGLRLESTTSQAQSRLVIDHVERPSEN